jgi:hypothetical protein
MTDAGWYPIHVGEEEKQTLIESDFLRDHEPDIVFHCRLIGSKYVLRRGDSIKLPITQFDIGGFHLVPGQRPPVVEIRLD